MQVQIPLRVLVENYRQFMAGELRHKNDNTRKFESCYICHQIMNVMIPEGCGSVNVNVYPNEIQKAITDQFRSQWIEELIGGGPQHYNSYSAMENWFNHTPGHEFASKCGEPSGKYRMRVLEQAFKWDPEFVFTFDL